MSSSNPDPTRCDAWLPVGRWCQNTKQEDSTRCHLLDHAVGGKVDRQVAALAAARGSRGSAQPGHAGFLDDRTESVPLAQRGWPSELPEAGEWPEGQRALVYTAASTDPAAKEALRREIGGRLLSDGDDYLLDGPDDAELWIEAVERVSASGFPLTPLSSWIEGPKTAEQILAMLGPEVADGWTSTIRVQVGRPTSDGAYQSLVSALLEAGVPRAEWMARIANPDGTRSLALGTRQPPDQGLDPRHPVKVGEWLDVAFTNEQRQIVADVLAGASRANVHGVKVASLPAEREWKMPWTITADGEAAEALVASLEKMEEQERQRRSRGRFRRLVRR